MNALLAAYDAGVRSQVLPGGDYRLYAEGAYVERNGLVIQWRTEDGRLARTFVPALTIRGTVCPSFQVAMARAGLGEVMPDATCVQDFIPHIVGRYFQVVLVEEGFNGSAVNKVGLVIGPA
jgi:hypothetical protein